MSTHACIQIGQGNPHLVGFVSHDHLHGQRGRVLAAFFEPPRDGVEGFAICHVVDWFVDTGHTYFSELPFSFRFTFTHRG